MSVVYSIISFISGAFLWEFFKFLFPELKQYFLIKKRAKETFYNNIDMLLKASDQLYGKMLSLSKEDFMTFIDSSKSSSKDPELNKIYIYYLFCNFWAQLEHLRIKNEYYSLIKIKKGKQLIKFIETFESRKYRILDRSTQRIIGEQLLIQNNQKFTFMSLNEFYYEFTNEKSQLYDCVKKLENKFSEMNKSEVKQKVLVYGMIVSMMINNYDSKHTFIRERPLYINKLNQKSKEMIKHNLLEFYLNFVKKKEQYYGQ
jgi:hypothetical protein